MNCMSHPRSLLLSGQWAFLRFDLPSRRPILLHPLTDCLTLCRRHPATSARQSLTSTGAACDGRYRCLHALQLFLQSLLCPLQITNNCLKCGHAIDYLPSGDEVKGASPKDNEQHRRLSTYAHVAVQAIERPSCATNALGEVEYRQGSNSSGFDRLWGKRITRIEFKDGSYVQRAQPKLADFVDANTAAELWIKVCRRILTKARLLGCVS